MVHISAILLIICIIEWIIIFWFRRNSGKKIDIEETVTFFRNFWGEICFIRNSNKYYRTVLREYIF